MKSSRLGWAQRRNRELLEDPALDQDTEKLDYGPDIAFHCFFQDPLPGESMEFWSRKLAAVFTRQPTSKDRS